ncbi:squalene synthase HpnC [Acidovorax sp. PRC11]|nr:squalene synthase HpnC [Acidovorax sp. PRC11]MDT0139570.1 squalene synthase HpnC [Acidovorax sp. PRC11]
MTTPLSTGRDPGIPGPAEPPAAPGAPVTFAATPPLAGPLAPAGTPPAPEEGAAAWRAQPVTHYENFPVASWLCPPALRAPIAAIYGFARTADDLADEGDATPPERLAALAEYGTELHRIAAGHPPGARWAAVFGPLQGAIRGHALPVPLLADLLSAFTQDIVRTAGGLTYADREGLLDYCRRSANPVGRLLLHLYGIHDARALARSDAICTALQLINFWQDFSVDLPRGRHYLADADLARFGVERALLQQQPLDPRARALVADAAAWARALMDEGAPLVHQVPGRMGWELRLVVQGGLRILDKVEALRGDSLIRRPVLGGWDWMRMVVRAVAM